MSEGGSFEVDGMSASGFRFLSNGGGKRLMLQQPGWATGNRWWLLKSPPGEAESHSPPTAARDNGLLFRELALPQVILNRRLLPLPHFPHLLFIPDPAAG